MSLCYSLLWARRSVGARRGVYLVERVVRALARSDLGDARLLEQERLDRGADERAAPVERDARELAERTE